MPTLFLQLSFILVFATFLGILAKTFKQPLILAYIFTGIIISLFGVFKDVDKSTLDLFSNLGIAFLLFLVGVELKLDDLKFVGKTAIFTGFGQIFFTALVGFILIAALGFSPIASAYMALAITFSSTVIIIKLLAEKHDLQSLYGKVTIGYLLVQDFAALLALMFLSGFGVSGGPSSSALVLIVVKGLILVGFAYVAARRILKVLFSLTSTSTELLFVSAIAWAFLMSALGAALGFSVAIGAFLAGVAIASSPYRIQISARVKPLRDFFTIIFFILLGASMSTGASGVLVSHVIILSLFILVGKPLIVMAVMLTLGFRNRTSFLVSITGAQISEFSLILLASGMAIGHVPASAVSLVASVGLVTITLSSYLITHGEKIYRVVEKHLSRALPEKPHDPYITNKETLSDHVILVGAEQMGWDILEFLKSQIKKDIKGAKGVNLGDRLVVVDFNPEIISSLTAGGFNAVFGDISDPEVLEELEFAKARLIVVTDPDVNDTHHLIKFAKSKDFGGIIVATSYWIHDAVSLYEMGADYVVVPEEIGGQHIAHVLDENWADLQKIKKVRGKNFDKLLEQKMF